MRVHHGIFFRFFPAFIGLASSVIPAGLSAADATAPAAAAAPAFRVIPGEISISQRVDYVLGDPKRPFVDADAYRAQMALEIVAPGSCALLGVEDYVLDAVVTDAGDALIATLPSGLQPCTDRGLNINQAQIVLHPGLPLAAHAYRGLRTVSGHFTVVWSTSMPETWTMTMAKIKAGPVTIPGHPELTLSLGESRPNQLETVFLASTAASIAVVQLQARDGKGQQIVGNGQRSERRETQHPQANGRKNQSGDNVLIFPRKLPADATIDVLYQAAPQRTRVDFTINAVDFGVELPALPTIRGSLAHGADEL
jgi:hypothetical protein